MGEAAGRQMTTSLHIGEIMASDIWIETVAVHFV